MGDSSKVGIGDVILTVISFPSNMSLPVQNLTNIVSVSSEQVFKKRFKNSLISFSIFVIISGNTSALSTFFLVTSLSHYKSFQDRKSVVSYDTVRWVPNIMQQKMVFE